jgi:Lrp/AsnC family transcriptional regulator for asnA, asnC and gidA
MRGRDGTIDETDASIILQLQTDGRRSYTRIAGELELSESAVRRRLQRLMEEGVVRVVALTDRGLLGLDVHALIGVRVSGDVEKLATVIAEIDEVERTAITTGPYDLIVEVACEDNDHLLSVVNRGLRKLPGVESMTTMTVLRSHDQSGTIDLR